MHKDRVPLNEIDGDRIRAARESRGWTQKKLAAECNKRGDDDFNLSTISPKTVWRVENGHGNAHRKTVDTILASLGGLRWEDVLRVQANRSVVPPLDYGRYETICQTLRIGAASALHGAREIMRRPYLAGAVHTSAAKITDRPSSDPTEAIDQVASERIEHVLRVAHEDKKHPLSDGFALIDEERGYISTYAPSDGKPQLQVWVDSIDDTTKGGRGLGGTCLISVYHQSVGWCCAVIGDVVRNALYFRVADQPSHALILQDVPHDGRTISDPPFAFRDPAGWPTALRSSGREILSGASVNLYVGKPERITKTAAGGQRLLTALGAGAELLGEGGSRGILLVAEGLVDAAVEFCKGFRPLDLIPGAYIAAGVPGVVTLDEKGAPLSFGPDPALEEALDRVQDEGITPGVFEPLRRTFIVAATNTLGQAVAKTL